MVGKLIRMSLFAALGVSVAALSVGPAASADNKDQKVPPIKEIMAKGHKGADARMAKITLAVKGGNWDEAQKLAKDLAENGALLGKNTPKKGDAQSWEKLAAGYAANTKAVAEAVDKKDAAAAKSAIETINASCKACHTAHRGK